MAKKKLRLSIHQTAPLLGEVGANEGEIWARIRASRETDLVVFPELALTGYGLRGRVSRLALPLVDSSPPLKLPSGSPPVIIGLPERGSDELIYNTALVLLENRILARHRKVYLPTYGLFDEGRYYAPGKEPPPVVTLPSGWKVGILICEDFWHPSLLYLLAIQGVEVVVVLAAAPGRGEPSAEGEGGEEDEGGRTDPHLFASTSTWSLLARTAALQYGIFLVLANRAGVEGGVTFAGESRVFGPDGRALGKAPQGTSAVLEIDLERRALQTARSPYSHLRDEDPDYLRRALNSLLERD